MNPSGCEHAGANSHRSGIDGAVAKEKREAETVYGPGVRRKEAPRGRVGPGREVFPGLDQLRGMSGVKLSAMHRRSRWHAAARWARNATIGGASGFVASGVAAHASIQVKTDRYTHHFPDHQDVLTARADAAFRGAGGRRQREGCRARVRASVRGA